MLCDWGNIVLIMADKSALCIGEKDMESELDMLFKKNLYTVAINLVQTEQADAAATAEVLRKYGDHLYSKQDYDEAMAQYIHTIGHLEPSYDEALQYISSLEPGQAGVTVKEYGKILIEHKQEETIDILMRLCTEDVDLAKSGTSNGAYLSMLPSPVDFLNIFIHHPQSLMDFLEKYADKVKDSPAQVEIHNTLLELYLSIDLNFPSIFLADDGIDFNRPAAPAMSWAVSSGNGKLFVNVKNSYIEKDSLERREKGLHLLKIAWPSDLEHPLYDVDLAIILCEINAFREGLLYLYEKL
ncbi:hypothetical protein PTKIN_Ptkin15bG0157500 [Pterospermum kingtungense]